MSNELYYRRDRQMFAVGFQTRPEFQAGAPELLFEGDDHISTAGNVPDYDVADDGRFLMIRKEEPSERSTSS